MLIVDRDFKCSATLCYGVGAVHDRFQALQTLLNRFASTATFAPIAVDGVIGKQTVMAINALQLSPTPHTIQSVAADVDALITQLSAQATTALTPAAMQTTPVEITAAVQQALDACNANARDPRCVRAQALCQRVHGTALANDPALKQLCDGVRTERRRRAVLIGASAVSILASVVGLVWHTHGVKP